jgi:hypothetical protein
MYTVTDSLGRVEIGDGNIEPSRADVDRVARLFQANEKNAANRPYWDEVRELFSKSKNDPRAALLIERARYQYLRDLCQAAKKEDPWALKQLRSMKSDAESGEPAAQKFWAQARTIGCPSNP